MTKFNYSDHLKIGHFWTRLCPVIEWLTIKNQTKKINFPAKLYFFTSKRNFYFIYKMV